MSLVLDRNLIRAWEPAHTRPNKIGCYLVRICRGRRVRILFSFWNGEHWCIWSAAETLFAVSLDMQTKAVTQNVEWSAIQ